jgi:hypothetical protein
VPWCVLLPCAALSSPPSGLWCLHCCLLAAGCGLCVCRCPCCRLLPSVCSTSPAILPCYPLMLGRARPSPSRLAFFFAARKLRARVRVRAPLYVVLSSPDKDRCPSHGTHPTLPWRTDQTRLHTQKDRPTSARERGPRDRIPSPTGPCPRTAAPHLSKSEPSFSMQPSPLPTVKLWRTSQLKDSSSALACCMLNAAPCRAHAADGEVRISVLSPAPLLTPPSSSTLFLSDDSH